MNASPAIPLESFEEYEKNLQDLAAVEIQRRDAVQAIHDFNRNHDHDTRTMVINNRIMKRIGALDCEPERQALEEVLSQAIRKRNELLGTHARLKMALGLTR